AVDHHARFAVPEQLQTDRSGHCYANMRQVNNLRCTTTEGCDRQSPLAEVSIDGLLLRSPEAGDEEAHVWPLGMDPRRRPHQRREVAIALLVARAGKQADDRTGYRLLRSDERRVQALPRQLIEIRMTDVVGVNAAFAVPCLLEWQRT